MEPVVLPIMILYFMGEKVLWKSTVWTMNCSFSLKVLKLHVKIHGAMREAIKLKNNFKILFLFAA